MVGLANSNKFSLSISHRVCKALTRLAHLSVLQTHSQIKAVAPFLEINHEPGTLSASCAFVT